MRSDKGSYQFALIPTRRRRLLVVPTQGRYPGLCADHQQHGGPAGVDGSIFRRVGIRAIGLHGQPENAPPRCSAMGGNGLPHVRVAPRIVLASGIRQAVSLVGCRAVSSSRPDIHTTPHGDAVNDTARRRAASLRAALCGVILDRGGPARLARANHLLRFPSRAKTARNRKCFSLCVSAGTAT
jgi:hypothetical protein